MIQFAKKMNTRCLEDFLTNNHVDIGPEAIDCINAFNIVLRHTPANQYSISYLSNILTVYDLDM